MDSVSPPQSPFYIPYPYFIPTDSQGRPDMQKSPMYIPTVPEKEGDVKNNNTNNAMSNIITPHPWFYAPHFLNPASFQPHGDQRLQYPPYPMYAAFPGIPTLPMTHLSPTISNNNQQKILRTNSPKPKRIQVKVACGKLF